MGATVLYMTVSRPRLHRRTHEGPGDGPGDGGERLHEWVLTGDEHRGSGVPAPVSDGV